MINPKRFTLAESDLDINFTQPLIRVGAAVEHFLFLVLAYGNHWPLELQLKVRTIFG